MNEKEKVSLAQVRVMNTRYPEKSANIMCECGHPAHMHQTGSCDGYAEKGMGYEADGTAFCQCRANHWEVADAGLNEVLAQRDGLLTACEKIRDKAAGWENSTREVPYWKLGSIAAAAINRHQPTKGGDAQ